MANTTNFGWETPDDTDLVKDGAAAIRTLGSAIDTSLVDLKGGTTSQVLSKNSNTDMDFIWVTQNDSDAIQNTIVDAKGDLIGATAGDTPARIASSGVNGDVLTVDTTTATGLKWATPASGGMTVLASGNLSGTSLDLQSISATYNQLTLILRDFSVSASAAMNFTINNTTGIYAYDNTSSSDGSVNDTNLSLFGGNNVDPTDYNNYLQIDLFDYANTTSHKYGNTRYFIRVAGDVYYGGWTYNLIRTTNAIDRITVNVGGSQTFDAGTYTLYGVK